MKIVEGAVGRWVLSDTPLAEGGQAVVWRARAADSDDGGWPQVFKQARARTVHRTALLREAELLGWLSEQAPGLTPRLLDTIHNEQALGMILARCPQDADAHAQHLIETEGALALESLLAFVEQIVLQVARLHAAGSPSGRQLIHRDLKPSNILVTDDGAPLLADLGAAAEVSQEPAATSSLGTPVWTPYEQCLAEQSLPEPTWDTYACGVMLFWWLTGVRPSYQDDPSPMLTQRGRDIHAALSEAITGEGHWAVFEALREGVPASELIDPRGHGAIQPSDAAAVAAGVRRLSSGWRYGRAALRRCSQQICRLLARCLSPLSHPSPPNRYWNALELATELAEIRTQLRLARLQHRRWALGFAAAAGILGTVGATALALSLTDAVPQAPPAVAASVRAIAPKAMLQEPAQRTDPLAAAQAAAPAPVPLSRGTIWFDRHEVSTAAYLECVSLGACPPPAEGEQYSGFRDPAQPIVGVGRDGAEAYCSEAGGRLPTASEFETAAAQLPAQPTCAQAHLAGCDGAESTVAVYALPDSASPAGIQHLIGNAWEWTSTTIPLYERTLFNRRRREPYAHHAVLIGGAFDASPADARPSRRHHIPPETAATDLSFRCVYDAPPGDATADARG